MDEREAASGFLQYVCAGKQPDLLKLYAFLCKPIFKQDGSAERKAAHAYLYGNAKYDDLKIRRLLSKLRELLELFLVWEDCRKDEAFIKLRTLSIYRRRKMDKHFGGAQLSARKTLYKSGRRDAAHHYAKMRLAEEQLRFSEAKNERSKKEYLQQTMDLFDLHYVMVKLKLACEMLTYHNVLGSEPDIPLLNEAVDLAERENRLELPAVAAYYHILMTFRQPEVAKHFENLKVLLSEKAHCFPPEEARELYYFALNHCAVNINCGKSQFMDEIFALYQIGLTTQLLFDGKYLSPWNYKNIVTVGLRLGKNEFVKAFIYEHCQSLEADFRENAFVYNLANYHFYVREYGKVLELLQQVEYDEIFYRLDARSLLLKTYYEAGETEALYALLNSFRQFLSRDKTIGKARKSTYRNLIFFVKKLAGINAKNKQTLERLQVEIAQTKAIADKNWLLQKLKEKG